MKPFLIPISFLIFNGYTSASSRISPPARQLEQLTPVPTPFTLLPYSNSNSLDELRRRQITVQISTCGYNNGDPTKPRTANSGFNCRVDTKNGLWGFCPTTVIAATDCGLAGCCIDTSNCSDGCGIIDVDSITTFTCATDKQEFCSTALLIDGPDQTYSYIACAPNSGTGILYAAPTLASVAASSTAGFSSSSTPAPSSTLAPSSSLSTPLVSSQSDSAPSTSLQLPTLAPASNTTTPDPASKSNVGPIVGGVLGGLALIGFFVLAAIFLTRKYQRNEAGNKAMPQDAIYRWRHGSPKTFPGGDGVYGYSSYQKYGSDGPSELSTRQEPIELES
ncbi:hypothetical protein F5884DRAFT_832546 [Xylogone sp. PMI_703]|nr:hypothetical protein F5884DRAFT_832546 [Xylogone sp. PMI_703]